MPKNYVVDFTKFLGDVDLADYREKYQPVKIVEMDMPKEIQAIDLLYRTYWEEKELFSFEKFFKRYFTEKRALLETFRKKVGMCEKCFSKGLPARIYRTWASILTQIHAGCVAETVFGSGTIHMSADLDHKGVDFQIEYGDKPLNIQIKKSSYSREVRTTKPSGRDVPGKYLTLEYIVLTNADFLQPVNRYGQTKPIFQRFTADKGLMRLKNGFTVFTAVKFQSLKRRIDAGEL